jgi:hypothetical protein
MTTLHHPFRLAGTGEVGGRRPIARRLRRIGLGAFFASVAVNAALGIYAVLAPEFGETQGKILGTSLSVTGAVLLALACEPAWERMLLEPVPTSGAVLGALGFSLTIAGIWGEPESEAFGKATASIMTVAVACAAASVLALARLAPRHRWVVALTLGLVAVGAALVTIVPWLGDDPGEWYLRSMGVVLIALAAFAVSVPVLHWVDRSALADAAPRTGTVRYCPYCGGTLAGELGTTLTCPRCGRDFRVVSAELPRSNLT